MSQKTFERLIFLLWLPVFLIFPTKGFAEAEAPRSLKDWFGAGGLVQALDVPAASDQGVEIKLNEVLLERDTVYLSITLTSDKIVDPGSLQLGTAEVGLVLADGEESFDLVRYYSDTGTPDAVSSDGSITFAVFAVVPERLLEKDEIPMKVKIDKLYRSVEGAIMPEEIKGSWQIDFTANAAEMRSATKSVTLDYPLVVNNAFYRMTALLWSPIQTKVKVTRYFDNDQLIYHEETGSYSVMAFDESILGIDIEDESGNKIRLTKSRNSYPTKDDNAWLIQTFYSDSKTDNGSWIKDAKTLTIKPYFVTENGPVNEGAGIGRYDSPAAMTVSLDSEPTELETFMADFEPDYTIWTLFDSANRYVKPVRISRTTPNGTVIMLDKVMVNEDNLSVSFLIGSDKLDRDQELLEGFEVGSVSIEAGPILPYPPEFELSKWYGGGGGGEPSINAVNEKPLVVANLRSKELMVRDGYVSPKDPMQVKVTVYNVKTCWGDSESFTEYSTWRCYSEEGPWVFEFETDGAELAGLTKEIEINETLSIDGQELTLKRLRFNPLQPILFTSGDDNYPGPEISGLHAFIEADDGTQLPLHEKGIPYAGFTRVYVNDEANSAFGKTKSVRISFCLNREWETFPEDFNYEEMRFYNCDPAWSATVDLE